MKKWIVESSSRWAGFHNGEWVVTKGKQGPMLMVRDFDRRGDSLCEFKSKETATAVADLLNKEEIYD